jgi:molybdate transport system substrate-binding protein
MLRLLPILLLATTLSAAEVRVFAAASLMDVLQEIGAAYERQTGDRVVFNFAGSSTLERQIEQGAPADVFLSADETKMDALQKQGLIVVSTRSSGLSNMLAIIGADIRTPRDLVGRRVALAEPMSVPAGIYARKWLTQIGLWKAIEPNVIPTENVRAALAAVESGNADAAIVYRTDVKKIAYLVRDGPVISYPFAALTHAEQPAAARRFLQFVRAPYAAQSFKAYGFIVRASHAP